MTKAKHWKPEGQSTQTPHLVLTDAAKAIEFYKEALGSLAGGRFCPSGTKFGRPPQN